MARPSPAIGRQHVPYPTSFPAVPPPCPAPGGRGADSGATLDPRVPSTARECPCPPHRLDGTQHPPLFLPRSHSLGGLFGQGRAPSAGCSVLSTWILGRKAKQLFPGASKRAGSIPRLTSQGFPGDLGLGCRDTGVGHGGIRSTHHAWQAGTEQPQLANSCVCYPSPRPCVPVSLPSITVTQPSAAPGRLPLIHQLQNQPKTTLPRAFRGQKHGATAHPTTHTQWMCPGGLPSWLLPDFPLHIPTSSVPFPGHRGHSHADEEIHKLIKPLPLRA